MSDTLTQLADKAAIRDLLYAYCRSVDRLDVALGHSIWHDDGHADYGDDIYQGPGKGVIDMICESHSAMTSHSHQVTNVIIDLDGDKAGSEAYVFATMRMAGENGPTQLYVWGRYLDRWEKRQGRWGIVHRAFVYDHEEMRSEVTPMGAPIRARRDASDPSYGVLTSRKWGQP